jgi:regulator of replication initiation timing
MGGSKILKKNRLHFLAIIVALLILTAWMATPASAASPQVSSTVSLQYFSIQAQYPSTVLPGETVQMYIQATAKSAVDLESLDLQVSLIQGNSLQDVTSVTIVSNQNIAASNTFTKNIQISIPQDAPRTSLFATFTETVQISYANAYSYSSYNFPYDYGCSYYTYANYNNMQSNCYYPYNSYSSTPSYSYYTTTDTGISPLSYINATTPEYTSLLSQYQSAQQQVSESQSQNQNLQQQITQLNQQNAQLQSQNQQLQQNLQKAQDSIAQQNSTNANLAAQLNTTNSTKQDLTYFALGFGIIAIFIGALAGRRGQPRKTQSVNPYASNYEPPKEPNASSTDT